MEPQVISPVSRSSKKLWLFIIGFVLLIILIPSGFFLYKQQTSKTVSNPFPKISYSCPVYKDFCSGGEIVNLTVTKPPFSGLAYQNLASGSAILAVIPGKYSSGVSAGKDGEKNNLITIFNEEFNIEADYQFQGQAYIPIGVGKGYVQAGDVVGWVSDKVLEKESFDKNYQLVVSVRDLKTKEFIKLD